MRGVWKYAGELKRGTLGLALGALFGLCGLLLADQPLHEIGVSLVSPDDLLPLLFLGVPVGMGFWPGVVSAWGRQQGLLTACLAALGTLPALLLLSSAEATHLAFVLPFVSVLTLWGALLGWWVVTRGNRGGDPAEPTDHDPSHLARERDPEPAHEAR